METISIPEDILERFIDTLKYQGAGEFQQGGRFSLSRQPFADGYVFYQNPLNGYVTISCNCSCGIKGINQIWEADMEYLAKQIKESQESEEE